MQRYKEEYLEGILVNLGMGFMIALLHAIGVITKNCIMCFVFIKFALFKPGALLSTLALAAPPLLLERMSH